VLFLIAASFFILFIFLLNYGDYYSRHRILGTELIALFILSELAIVKIGLMAKYLRAHKSEPFYLVSILNGIFVVLILIFVLPTGLNNTFISLAALYWFTLLPISFYIFKRFTKEFYSQNNKLL